MSIDGETTNSDCDMSMRERLKSGLLANMRGFAHHIRLLVFTLGVLVCALGLGRPAFAQISAGEIGGACYSDGTCSNGVCIGGAGTAGFCAPCGMPGQKACPSQDPNQPAWCHLSGSGFETVATEQGSFCIDSGSSDCGQVGTAACDRDGQSFCYYGILSASRAGAICIACGGLGEACCSGTDLICDTGTCQGGVCLPRPDTRGLRGQIEEAISECRLSEAQGRIDALPAGTAFADDMRALLKEAQALEDKARRLFDQGRNSAREARMFYDQGDYGNAALTFHRVLVLLNEARDATRCTQVMAVIDDGIDMTLRNLARSEDGVALVTAEEAIDLCSFAMAREELAKVVGATVQRDRVQELLDQAVTTEQRVREAYAEGLRLSAEGDGQFAQGSYQRASSSYQSARTAFLKARQITQCADTRTTIDQAVAVTGRDIMRAEDASSAAADAAEKAQAGSPAPGSISDLAGLEREAMITALKGIKERWIKMACETDRSGCAYDPTDVINILAEFILSRKGVEQQLWLDRLAYTDQCIMADKRNARRCYDESRERITK